MTCKLPHRYDVKFKDLPYRQQGPGRHICAGCAYEAGFKLGKSNIHDFNLEYELNKLPDSQAGEVRHKDAAAAFDLGHAEGRGYSSL